MNEGLHSPDSTSATGRSIRRYEAPRPGASLLWAITLHSAAGQRWLRHDPPEIEELKSTLAVIETMCALFEHSAPLRAEIADNIVSAESRSSHE